MYLHNNNICTHRVKDPLFYFNQISGDSFTRKNEKKKKRNNSIEIRFGKNKYGNAAYIAHVHIMRIRLFSYNK